MSHAAPPITHSGEFGEVTRIDVFLPVVQRGYSVFLAFPDVPVAVGPYG